MQVPVMFLYISNEQPQKKLKKNNLIWYYKKECNINNKCNQEGIILHTTKIKENFMG